MTIYERASDRRSLIYAIPDPVRGIYGQKQWQQRIIIRQSARQRRLIRCCAVEIDRVCICQSKVRKIQRADCV